MALNSIIDFFVWRNKNRNTLKLKEKESKKKQLFEVIFAAFMALFSWNQMFSVNEFWPKKTVDIKGKFLYYTFSDFLKHPFTVNFIDYFPKHFGKKNLFQFTLIFLFN